MRFSVSNLDSICHLERVLHIFSSVAAELQIDSFNVLVVDHVMIFQ